jgi:predicted RNase H-like nuclease
MSRRLISFNLDLASLSTSVELINLPSVLRNRPDDLATVAVDIPIGLLDFSRACDRAARKLLGRPRCSSVFAAPCRACLPERNHAAATATSFRITGRGLSQQALGITAKIIQVDDSMTPLQQKWVFEVHPEVCFWALAGGRPMAHRKKTKTGVSERLDLSAPSSQILSAIC